MSKTDLQVLKKRFTAFQNVLGCTENILSLYAIESATTSKDDFQKVVSFESSSAVQVVVQVSSKAVQVVVIERDSLKADWEATGPFLNPLALACRFQNSPPGFKMVHPALKLSDSFEAGWAPNWFVTYTSEERIQHNAK